MSRSFCHGRAEEWNRGVKVKVKLWRGLKAALGNSLRSDGRSPIRPDSPCLAFDFKEGDSISFILSSGASRGLLHDDRANAFGKIQWLYGLE